MVGIVKTQELVKDLFVMAKIVIKHIKASKELAVEFKDIDAVEGANIVISTITEELIPLWNELKEPKV